MNSTASLSVANTISSQIGSRALFMIGAKNLCASENSLSFKIMGNAKKVTHIRVTLTLSDTYRVEFLRCVGTKPLVTIADRDDVYAENLLAVIESETGLRTSL